MATFVCHAFCSWFRRGIQNKKMYCLHFCFVYNISWNDSQNSQFEKFFFLDRQNAIASSGGVTCNSHRSQYCSWQCAVMTKFPLNLNGQRNDVNFNNQNSLIWIPCPSSSMRYWCANKLFRSIMVSFNCGITTFIVSHVILTENVCIEHKQFIDCFLRSRSEQIKNIQYK